MYICVYLQVFEVKQAVYEFVRVGALGRGGGSPLHLACARDSSSVIDFILLLLYIYSIKTNLGWSLPHLRLPIRPSDQPLARVRCRPQRRRQRRQHGVAHGGAEQAGQTSRDPGSARPWRSL